MKCTHKHSAPCTTRKGIYDWFSAAKNDSVNQINEMIDLFSGTYEKQQTLLEQQIIQGFAAVHYAAFYGQQHALIALLDEESLCRTQFEVQMESPGIGENASVKLSAGSSCLQIALLRGNDECVKAILNFLNSNLKIAKKFVGTNTDQLSHIATAAMCNCCVESLSIIKSQLFGIEWKLFDGQQSLLCRAAQYITVNTLNAIKQLNIELYAKHFLYVNLENKNVLELFQDCQNSRQNSEKVQTETSKQRNEQQLFIKSIKETIYESYKFCLKDNKYAELVKRFMGGRSEDEVFGNGTVVDVV